VQRDALGCQVEVDRLDRAMRGKLHGSWPRIVRVDPLVIGMIQGDVNLSDQRQNIHQVGRWLIRQGSSIDRFDIMPEPS
jgi:hypothetical protein